MYRIIIEDESKAVIIDKVAQFYLTTAKQNGDVSVERAAGPGMLAITQELVKRHTNNAFFELTD